MRNWRKFWSIFTVQPETPLILETPATPVAVPPLPAGGNLKDMSASDFLEWAVAAMQIQPGRAMDMLVVSKINGVTRLVMALDDKDVERLIH